jgi:uncharacterized protein YndB with AHSA1/START domain
VFAPKDQENPMNVPEQIAHEVLIEAPVERVWAMLTEAEHVRRWFAFDGAAIDLRPGGEIIMHWKEHGTYYARVERVEPPRRFAYRGSHRPDEQPRDDNATLVEFTLEPHGSGTLLRVVESGFRALDLTETEQAALAAGNVQGWSGGFAALQEYARSLTAPAAR